MLTNILSYIFVLILLIEVLYYKTYTHVTLWTWCLHCICFFNTELFSICYFGAYYVLIGYIVCLIYNPYLEYDLVQVTRQWKATWAATRSLVLHLFPIFWVQYLSHYNRFNFDSAIYYIIFPLGHAFLGLFYPFIDAYQIYIVTPSNPIKKDFKLYFIITQVFVLIMTAFLVRTITN